ncbi:MAG: DNA polymerase III subunit delta [Candidatus Limnocylindrales bacterium]
MSGQGGPPNVAFLSGDDAYAIEAAVHEMAVGLGTPGPPLQRSPIEADGGAPNTPPADSTPTRRSSRLLDRIEQELSTAPLFGGGTLVVVRQPGSLIRETAARERLVGLVGMVPQGNGLAMTELAEEGPRGTKGSDSLRQAVASAGGVVRDFPTPTRERMERWLGDRAQQLGVRLGPGAARLLAERVGAYVREGDVDRRRQTELANAELEKLALYRPGGQIGREDVEELVTEAVPGSMWALLDAIGARRPHVAAELAGRLLGEGLPLQVVISQVHRRLRELVTVREVLAGGTPLAQLPRLLKLQPFRAQKLAQQAGVWSLAELEAAMERLFELDLLSKGMAHDASPVTVSEDRSVLGFWTWLAENTGGRSVGA